MAKVRTRAVLTPAVTSDFSKESKRIYWKQILPKQSINYTAKDGSRQVANFDDAYLADLAKMDGIDSVGFLLADTDNKHTMDPERWRASVTAMEVRDDGLYGRFEFPTAKLAQAVINNPNLGVSARIRENIERSDGSTVGRGIIHVLGTLDPQVSGMSPWQAADFSASDDEVLDLSNASFSEGNDMSGKNENKALGDYTDAEIDAMSDDEINAFLEEFVPGIDAILEDDENEGPADELEDEFEDDEDEHAEGELVGAGAELSNTQSRDIELANAQAASANSRASEALRRMAEAEWRETRSAYLADGVPPHLLDLAAPVLNRPDDMVIDLSNTPDDDINVSAIVRGLLDSAKGTIDLSTEVGHNGTFTAGDGEDPDAELLARWTI